MNNMRPLIQKEEKGIIEKTEKIRILFGILVLIWIVWMWGFWGLLAFLASFVIVVWGVKNILSRLSV